MDDPLWASRVLGGRAGEPSRQPGKETRWRVYRQEKREGQAKNAASEWDLISGMLGLAVRVGQVSGVQQLE